MPCDPRHAGVPGPPGTVEAILRPGAENGDRLAEALAGLSMEGATGLVRFDAQRGVDTPPALAIVREGGLVPLHRNDSPGRP